MMLVTAAAMQTVFPVPGGPWIKVMRSSTALESIAFTARVWEGFRGLCGKRSGIGLLGEEGGQSSGRDGNHIARTKGFAEGWMVH